MNRGKFLFWGAVFFLNIFVSQARADESAESLEAPGSSTVAIENTAVESKVIGNIDLRPSYTSKAGEFHTENYVELGYQFNPKTQVSAAHNFTTNLYDPQAADSSLKLAAVDAYLRAKFNKIWVSSDTKLSLSYQPRFYLPITQANRDAGMLTAIRNYLTLTQELTDSISFSTVLLPILHVYSRSGSVASDGTAKANPFLEGRVYFVTDFTLTKKLSLSLPVMFHATRYANFQAGAKLNNTWGYFMWVFPEIIYALTPQIGVGLAYYSDNLVKEDLSGFTFGEGLEKGITQLVLQASL